jgi:hypothetical protein
VALELALRATFDGAQRDRRPVSKDGLPEQPAGQIGATRRRRCPATWAMC